jgi:hypothetical protein
MTATPVTPEVSEGPLIKCPCCTGKGAFGEIFGPMEGGDTPCRLCDGAKEVTLYAALRGVYQGLDALQRSIDRNGAATECIRSRLNTLSNV